MVAVFAFLAPQAFPTFGNFINVLNQASLGMIIAAGLTVPLRERPRRLRQRPAAQRHDQPRFLRDRNEAARRHFTALLVRPARERFEALDAPRRQIADRLEAQVQLALFDRAAERGLDPELLAHRIERIRPMRLGPPAVLGALGRELRVADQLVGVGGAVGAERDADRAGHADLVIREAERPGQCAAQPLGEVIGVPCAVDRHQDAELVAADARQHIMCPQRPAQASRDGDQQFVAGQPAEAGVDPPESFEVDHHHRVARAIGGRHGLQPVAEPRPVGEAGQAIGRHLAPQAVLGPQFRGLIQQADEAAVGVTGIDAGEGDAVLAGIHHALNPPGELFPRIAAGREADQAPAQPFRQRPGAAVPRQVRGAEGAVHRHHDGNAIDAVDQHRRDRQQIERAFLSR